MKYFSITELIHSDTADRLGIANILPIRQRRALIALADNVLDPLREAWGRPIIVNSGYRCPELNKAVGGVPTSMHLTGNAADITTGNPTDNRRLYQLAIDLRLPFFELIGRKYDFRWLHISHAPDRTPRKPA